MDLGIGIWDVGFGMWDLGCEMWDVDLGCEFRVGDFKFEI